jgi:hypothetical protein
MVTTSSGCAQDRRETMFFLIWLSSVNVPDPATLCDDGSLRDQ